MSSTYSAYDLYSLLKKEGSSYEDLMNAIEIRNRELPAYESLILTYLANNNYSAEVKRVDGIKEPSYAIIGYDRSSRTVFLQEKSGPFGSHKGQEMKQLGIEELIFGPYRIWNIVNPQVEYFYQNNYPGLEDGSDIDLPF